MADLEKGLEEECNENKDEENSDEKPVKPVHLDLHLIVKRHLPLEASQWTQNEMIQELNKIKRLRLDRENIGGIDGFELLSTDVTHLYLQFNKIQKIENLECLPNLQVLILSHNQISKLEGISHLQKLVFFDISNNCIEELNPDDIPKSIVILNLTDNPCAANVSHRKNLIQWLPKLKHLDGSDISNKDRISAGTLDPNDVVEDSDEEEENDNDDAEDNEDDVRHEAGDEIMDASSQNQPIIGYKQLPKILPNIHDVATDMLMRSQKRLEKDTSMHRKHIQEMTNIRIMTKIKPIPHLSKPHDI
ncbi:leucine-rich repeat-containing protein 46-like [Physella acuta]|uniref:leucine-rich repeat-containing protein 46-like n=1 Tax=Physella acuta TaxID=109671 RepID=UPI0027DDA351|nr:leucine-rich repeat-containing protein 46-like [Physella acuta]